MAVYRKAGASYLEDGLFLESSHVMNPPLSLHRKSKSLANSLVSEKGNLINQILLQGGDSDSDRLIETLAIRLQKSEADFTCHTPEMLLKEENDSSNAISAITVNVWLSGPSQLAELSREEWMVKQVTDNGSLSSIWPTSKWSLNPDFQALSTVAATRPILDGLPLPMGRKNKTAVD